MEEGLFGIMLQYHILEGEMEPLGPTGISLLKLLIISISVTIKL